MLPSYAVGKDESAARHSAITGSMLKRICTVAWAFTGVACYAMFKGQLPVEKADQAFGLAIKVLLPVGLTGLMVSCVFAAMMSNASALMLFAAGIFTRDIYTRFSPREHTDKEMLRMGRVVSVLVVACGTAVSMLFPNLREGFIYFMQVCLFASFALLGRALLGNGPIPWARGSARWEPSRSGWPWSSS